jgi:hypothetical protein
LSAHQKVRLVIAKEGGFLADKDEESTPPAFGGGNPADGSLKRNIPSNHQFDPKALKPLARMLFSTSVSLGHAVASYKEFARLKSARISPDGMLGGRGYVLKVKDVRAKLQQACELLSAVTDTIHDEMNAPHWRPGLEGLGENDAEDVTEFLDEAEEVLEDPERFGEKELNEIEKKNDGPDGTPNTPPEKEQGSQLPGGSAKEIGMSPAPVGEQQRRNQTKNASWKVDANSSLPVNTLPGPRVDHLDRGEQTGPYGSYNTEEVLSEPEWGRNQNDYAYPSEFNNLSDKTGLEAWGESAVPDANSEPTETSGNDFGLGYGAKGQGSEGYGTKAPDGRGVYGPASGLPNNPAAPTRDTEEGTTPGDNAQRNLWACGCAPKAESKLPFDGPYPVARSDYFDGEKGAADVQPAESRMPGDQAPGLYNYDRDTPGVGQSVEQPGVPYTKYDWTTHNYRNDIQDVFRHEDDNRTGSNG